MAETDDERKKRQHAEVAAYEKANGIVPGTAQHRGDGPGRGASGGQDWAGRARMAEARAAAGVELDDLDREAITRSKGAAA